MIFLYIQTCFILVWNPGMELNNLWILIHYSGPDFGGKGSIEVTGEIEIEKNNF